MTYHDSLTDMCCTRSVGYPGRHRKENEPLEGSGSVRPAPMRTPLSSPLCSAVEHCEQNCIVHGFRQTMRLLNVEHIRAADFECQKNA
mmetsp:Transcript_15606/g.29038  ORF Transcript_15606/g.29038 Transcript_15606/m.29038 type:complete len:88 (-) Transcript_15606:1356-1619(-)